jgi:hypothetical protein
LIKAFGIFGFLVSSGCRYDNGERVREKPVAKVITLAERTSGYRGSIEAWREFLTCWYEAYRGRYQELLLEDADLPDLPILGKYKFEHIGQQSDQDMLKAIGGLEDSLGVNLPKSYIDFLVAYQPPVIAPQPVPWGTSIRGLYSLSQVNRFSILEPELFKVAEEYAITSSDSEYFVYGMGQRYENGRTSNLKDALVVGKYGDSSYELIVLYPQVRTMDGEMEAALHYHAGEFRAPSFAELMRQLSIMEISTVDHVPPYPQEILKGTCADKLPIADAWWE